MLPSALLTNSGTSAAASFRWARWSSRFQDDLVLTLKGAVGAHSVQRTLSKGVVEIFSASYVNFPLSRQRAIAIFTCEMSLRMI